MKLKKIINNGNIPLFDSEEKLQKQHGRQMINVDAVKVVIMLLLNFRKCKTTSSL